MYYRGYSPHYFRYPPAYHYNQELLNKIHFLRDQVARQEEDLDELHYRLRRIEQQLGYSFTSPRKKE